MGSKPFAVRIVTAFVLFCSVLAPLVTVTPAMARDVPVDVDLAAISLTTADLDAAGFGRYMIGASEMNDIEYFPYWTELEIGLSIEEQTQALEDFGFLRAHSVFYFGPRDPGETISRSQIVTTIALYEDSDGAEAAYDLFEDASDSPSNTELRGWDTFGDRSQGLNDDASDGRSGMMVSVLLDNLVFRFYTYFPEDEPIDEDAFADLIDVALDRIEIGREAEQPALSNLVLRFDGLWAWRDLYMWRDGVMNRYVNQTEDVEYYAEEAESVGETEHFSMGTLLNAEETAENSEFVWQRVGLRRYEDEDAAETRFAEMLDSLANDEGFEAFDLVDVDFGDESFSYDAIWSESYPYHESYVYARYGEVILIFGFEAPVPTRDALDSIIDAQIDCFEDGDCLDRIPLSREVIALMDSEVTADEATVEPDEDDSDDQDSETESRDKGNITFPSNDDDVDDDDAGGRDDSLETFTSDTFDFSVSYDPEIWSLSSQAPNADGEEFLRFTHETATQVYVIATHAFVADDLEGCLEGAFERYGWDSTGEFLFGNATDIDVDDESATFFIPAATSIVGTTAALRGECRAMDDGVLTIFAYLPADEPDVIPADTLEIANELIDGIVIGG